MAVRRFCFFYMGKTKTGPAGKQQTTTNDNKPRQTTTNNGMKTHISSCGVGPVVLGTHIPSGGVGLPVVLGTLEDPLQGGV